MGQIKHRKGTNNKRKQQKLKNKGSRTKQIIYMIITLVITMFVISQVYFLIRYTLGYETKSNQLMLYKWINKVENKDVKKTYTNNVEK